MEQSPPVFQYYQSQQAELEAGYLRQRLLPPEEPKSDAPQSEAGDAFEAVSAAKGFALSGGGIRSATFNLGLLQALAQADRLKEIDFLSTVSGGGYIGSFLGRLYHRAAQEAPEAPPATTAANVESVLASDAAPVLRWLRDYGRYLAPQGLKDRLFAFGIYSRNLLTIHVLLGVTLMTAFLGWAALRIWLPTLFLGAETNFPFAYLPDGSGLSPAWVPVLGCTALIVSVAWAYWMHRDSASLAWEQRIVGAVVASIAALALYQQLPIFMVDTVQKLHPALILGALIIGSGALVATFVVGVGLDGSMAAIRNRLSTWLRLLLSGLLACALFALLDDAAYQAFLYFGKADAPRNALIGAGLTGALLAGLRALAQAFASRVEAHRLSQSGRWGALAINVIGIFLLLLMAFGWAYAVQAFVWSGLPRGTIPREVWPVLGAALPLGLLVLLAGRNLDVLNLSSLHTFYTARLTRAYLGPGNPERGLPWTRQPAHSAGTLVAVSKVVEGDDVDWANYAPHRHGGPLHLVNINVNQTRYSASGDFQPDRQGWNLAVGPAGFNLGRSRWQPGDWPAAEALRLGQWVAISGAAFTTGAGPHTGLGFSSLLGLLGIRLGYWWRAGDGKQRMRAPHMLRALWQEITGIFDPDRSTHWYLSDGGHFENTAAYELIRRRIKRIVVADCGADPQYEFADLASLALKARIDFSAEIEFFGTDDLDRLWQTQPDIRALFTAPEAMNDRYGPSLLLALVRYPDDPLPGWMVVAKPRLPEQLPADLAHYAEREDDFPQQTTQDQFYDEAQWESTHKLGRLVGDHLTRALAALPAWQTVATHAPVAFTGADWLAGARSDKPAAAASEPSTPASLMKIYAPLMIALWTGFEFYSNYQQTQAKEAAETTKFALSRIDALERQVFGKEGCANADTPLAVCPTVPAQVLLVRQLLAELPTSSAKPLSDITAKIEEAVNVKKPQRNEAVAQANAVPTQAIQILKEVRPVPVAPDIRSRALVYIQIYDEERRADGKRMIERLLQAGLTPAQLPGVENVVKATQATGAKPPAHFDKLTVIYYHAEDKALAEWIAQQAASDASQIADLRDLGSRYPNVKNGLVELWLP